MPGQLKSGGAPHSPPHERTPLPSGERPPWLLLPFLVAHPLPRTGTRGVSRGPGSLRRAQVATGSLCGARAALGSWPWHTCSRARCSIMPKKPNHASLLAALLDARSWLAHPPAPHTTNANPRVPALVLRASAGGASFLAHPAQPPLQPLLSLL